MLSYIFENLVITLEKKGLDKLRICDLGVCRYLFINQILIKTKKKTFKRFNILEADKSLLDTKTSLKRHFRIFVVVVVVVKKKPQHPYYHTTSTQNICALESFRLGTKI